MIDQNFILILLVLVLAGVIFFIFHSKKTVEETGKNLTQKVKNVLAHTKQKANQVVDNVSSQAEVATKIIVDKMAEKAQDKITEVRQDLEQKLDEMTKIKGKYENTLEQIFPPRTMDNEMMKKKMLGNEMMKDNKMMGKMMDNGMSQITNNSMEDLETLLNMSQTDDRYRPVLSRNIISKDLNNYLKKTL